MRGQEAPLPLEAGGRALDITSALYNESGNKATSSIQRDAFHYKNT